MTKDEFCNGLNQALILFKIRYTAVFNMENHKIDFLKERYTQTEPLKKKPFLFFGHRILIGALVLLTVGGIFSYHYETHYG